MNVKILCILLISICLTNCSGRQTSSINPNQSGKTLPFSDTLRNHLDLKTKISIAEENNTKEDLSQKNTIIGNVVFMNSYCGGARPSQEILDSYQQEYPLVNSTILVQQANGKSKPFQVSTDSKGLIHEDLMPGIYNYFMTEKIDKTMKCSFNASCKTWLARCFGQLTINERQNKGYKIVFQFGCNPCLPPRP
jgi:hypothetical protein